MVTAATPDPGDGPQMDHERLDVYTAALDFVEFAHGLLKRMPGGRVGLDSQLLRAATSIPLNIAEGAGEFSAKDKARFYRMARRSATECAAALDVSQRLGLTRGVDVGPGRFLLRRIVAMLTQMVRGLEVSGRSPAPAHGTRTLDHASQTQEPTGQAPQSERPETGSRERPTCPQPTK
jgi:four helix bundle protein